MTITKYLHSCLAVKEGETAILIDPGNFVFIEGRIAPEQLARVDGIFFTHVHQDHCAIDSLKAIRAKSPDAQIFGHPEVVAALREAQIDAKPFSAGDMVRIGQLSVGGVKAPHESIEPVPTPGNTGILMNDRFLHPGDSHHAALDSVEILCLPTAAPWSRITDVWQHVTRLKPRHVIPIHDAFLKDFFRDAFDSRFAEWIKPWGGAYHALKAGESVTID